jgi:hypothetical protein
MLFLSRQQRREARMRAPDYAHYYHKLHGAEAEREILALLKSGATPRYKHHLLRLALRILRSKL